MADTDLPSTDRDEERKIRLVKLKRELQSKAKRRRKHLLQAANIRKTSIDRSLEKSFLSKSELSWSNSIARRQILLSLNMNLARQVQQFKENAREMQTKIQNNEINVCQLEFECNHQKQVNESLKLDIERLKVKCIDLESWKKSAAKKCKEMFKLFNDSQVVSNRESVPLQDLSGTEASAGATELEIDKEILVTKFNNLPFEVELTEPEELEIVPEKDHLQLGRTGAGTLFDGIVDMTAITEEDGGFTPNVTLNESFNEDLGINHIFLSDEKEEKELRKSRRGTFTVSNSLQIEALPTPIKINKVRHSTFFNNKLEDAARDESYFPSVIFESDRIVHTDHDVTVGQIDLNKTKFDIEDMELTGTLNNLIILGELKANNAATKTIEPTSLQCVQNVSPIASSLKNDIDCLTVALSDPTLPPCVQNDFPTPSCSLNNHYTNNCSPSACFNEAAFRQTSSLTSDHQMSSPKRSNSVGSEIITVVKQDANLIKSKSKNKKQNKDEKLANKDILLASSKPTEISCFQNESPTPSCSTTNPNLKDCSPPQSMSSSVCPNKAAFRQTSSLASDHNKMSPKQSNSVESETITVVKQDANLKKSKSKNKKQNKDEKLANKDILLASSKPTEISCFQNESPTPSCSTTNHNLKDCSPPQSMSSSVCPNKAAFRQTSSLASDHNKMSPKQSNSVESETITVVKQDANLKKTKSKTKKLNKDEKLISKDVLLASSEPTALPCFQNESPMPSCSTTNHHLKDCNPPQAFSVSSKKAAVRQTSSLTSDHNKMSPPKRSNSVGSENITGVKQAVNLKSAKTKAKKQNKDEKRANDDILLASSEPTALSCVQNQSPTPSGSTNYQNNHGGFSDCSNNEAPIQTSLLVTDYDNRMSSPKRSITGASDNLAVAKQVVNIKKAPSKIKQQNTDENEELKTKFQKPKPTEQNKHQQVDYEILDRLPKMVIDNKKSGGRKNSLAENLKLMNTTNMDGTSIGEPVSHKICQMESLSSSSKKVDKADLKTDENNENEVRRPRRDCNKTMYKEPSLRQKLRRP